MFERLQILILLCANPDGQLYSQTIELMWRKNRSHCGAGRGADLNRNFNVAFDFQIAFTSNAFSASADPCNFNVYVSPRRNPSQRHGKWSG